MAVKRNKSWEPYISEMEEFFAKTELPPGTIRLDQCTVISDPKRFVRSSLATIRKHDGNPTYSPYISRLHSFYKMLKK